MRTPFVLAVAALTPLTAADTIHVPGDQPGIQAALDITNPGDEVVIAPDTYGIADGLVIRHSDLTIRGETGDPHDVVLLGDGSHAPVSVSALTGISFRGLTFTDCNTAVSLSVSQAEFESCRFFRNTVSANPQGSLVGIGADITITGCAFERHTSINPGVSGAVVVFGGALDVTDSMFRDNFAATGETQPQSRGASVFAGSIFIAPGVAEGASVTIADSTFHDNECDFGAAVSGIGAGIEIDRCRFVNNIASFGGAIFADQFVSGGTTLPGSLRVTNSMFHSNQALRHGILNGIGAAVGTAGGDSIEMVNSTFHRNIAEVQGGVYYAFPTVEASTLANCLMADNSIPEVVAQGPVVSTHNLSGPAESLGLANPLGPDGEPGTLDEDFTLLPGSPAIDAGSNAFLAAPENADIDGLPRFVDDPETTDTGAGTAPIVDIGAHEYAPPAPCGPADLAPPFGLLDLADVLAFVTAFTSMSPAGDFNGDGLFDLADIVAFVTAFNAGCP